MPLNDASGSCWVKLAGNTNQQVPTDNRGGVADGTTVAANLGTGGWTNVLVEGLVIGADMTAARTVTVHGATSAAGDYTGSPVVIYISASAKAGTYFPVGGLGGALVGFANGGLVGGIAITASNADLVNSTLYYRRA